MDTFNDCMTFEQGKKCCGASGRKYRRVCIYCPNYDDEWKKRTEERKEEENHGEQGKNVH